MVDAPGEFSLKSVHVQHGSFVVSPIMGRLIEWACGLMRRFRSVSGAPPVDSATYSKLSSV